MNVGSHRAGRLRQNFLYHSRVETFADSKKNISLNSLLIRFFSKGPLDIEGMNLLPISRADCTYHALAYGKARHTPGADVTSSCCALPRGTNMWCEVNERFFINFGLHEYRPRAGWLAYVVCVLRLQEDLWEDRNWTTILSLPLMDYHHHQSQLRSSIFACFSFSLQFVALSNLWCLVWFHLHKYVYICIFVD